MSRQISAVRAQTELLANILLYGSVGTASSAVVYLLHDQIRQLRQWRIMIHNGRKLSEMARKHGFSESTLRRLNDTSIESYLIDQQARGNIQLELIEGVPKWTSSSYRGQIYHVVPTYSKSTNRRRSRREKVGEIQPKYELDKYLRYLKSSRPQLLESRNYSRCAQSGNLFWSGPQQRLHRLSGIPSKQRLFCSDTRVSSDMKRSSVLNDIHKRQPARSLPTWRSSGVDCSFSPTGSTENISIKSGPQLSSIDNIKERCVQFLFKYGVDGSWRQPEPDMSVISRSVLQVAADSPAGSWTLRAVNPLISELINLEQLTLSDAVPKLHDGSALILLLKLVQNHHHKAKDDEQVVILAFDALFSLIKTAGASRAWLRSICRTLTEIVEPQNLPKMCGVHLSSLSDEKALGFFLPTLVLQAFENPGLYISHLNEMLQHLESVLPAKEFDKNILNCLKNSPSISDSVLCLVLDVIIKGSLPENMARVDESRKTPNRTSEIIPSLLVISLEQNCWETTLRILEQYSHALDSKQISQASFFIIDQCRNFLRHNPRPDVGLKILELYSKGILPAEKDAIAHIVKDYYLLSPTSARVRSKFLHDAVAILRSDLDCVDILLSPSSNPKDQEMADTLLHCQINHIGTIWKSTRDISRVSNLYADFTQAYFGNSVSMMQTVLRIAIEASNTSLMSSIAWSLYKKYPELRSNWNELLMILSALAKCGQTTALSRILGDLNVSGLLPTYANESTAFCDINVDIARVVPCGQALDFIETCFTKYGFVLGPRAFNMLLFRIIAEEEVSSCVRLLQKLLAFDSRQTHPIGITRYAIKAAMRGARSRRAGDAPFNYYLLKMISSSNESLISKNLCLEITEWLAVDSRGSEKVIHNTRPYLNGKFWSAAQMAQLRQSKFLLRASVLRSIADRSPWLSQETNFHPYFEKEAVPSSGNRPRVGGEKNQLCLVLMQRLLALDDVEAAVKAYESFMLKNNIPSRRLTDIAVSAYLRLGDTDRARSLSDRLGKSGQNSTAIELLWIRKEIINGQLTVASLRQLILEWYRSFESSKPRFLHIPLCDAVNRLLYPKSPEFSTDAQGAIQLLLEVYNSTSMKRVTPGIEVYIAFFSAYAANKDIRGIIWTFLKIFQNNLPLTPRFFRAMKNRSEHMLQEMKKSRDGRLKEVRLLWFHIKSLCGIRMHWQKSLERSMLKNVFNILLRDSKGYQPANPQVLDENPGKEFLDTTIDNPQRLETIDILKAKKFNQIDSFRIKKEISGEHVAAGSVKYPLPSNTLLRQGLSGLKALTFSSSLSENASTLEILKLMAEPSGTIEVSKT